MVEKGRGNLGRGAANRHAKLTEDSVRQARIRYAAGVTISALAREHGVDFTTMASAVYRETWTHVA